MQRSTSRRERERGATLVEAALVTPLLFMLVFGVIEFGTAWFHRSAVEDMSAVGARAASVSGSDAVADYQILQAVRRATADTGAVTAVVVYRATAPGDPLPDACRTASVVNTATVRGCNRYGAADLSLAADRFGCTGTARDATWCPSTRRTALQGAKGPPDYVGVYVETHHQSATGLLGRLWDFRSVTVLPIEPRTYS